jgi:hypothetical protein
LIIDAFGELRDQLDAVKETLEVKYKYFFIKFFKEILIFLNFLLRLLVLFVEWEKIFLIKFHMDLKFIR